MIIYINNRLNEWSRWRMSDKKLIADMLGAHSCWPEMLGEAESTETVRQVGTLVPLDENECCETDKAVCSLPRDLKETIMECYPQRGTSEAIARRIGVSRDGLSIRINQAHARLLSILNDMAAGVYVPRTQEERATIATSLLIKSGV